jgi:hypothetical protein
MYHRTIFPSIRFLIIARAAIIVQKCPGIFRRLGPQFITLPAD